MWRRFQTLIAWVSKISSVRREWFNDGNIRGAGQPHQSSTGTIQLTLLSRVKDEQVEELIAILNNDSDGVRAWSYTQASQAIKIDHLA
jgi:hypothetical protein